MQCSVWHFCCHLQSFLFLKFLSFYLKVALSVTNKTEGKHFNAFKRKKLEWIHFRSFEKLSSKSSGWMREVVQAWTQLLFLSQTTNLSTLKENTNKNSYPDWYSLSARSVLLDSCSSSQPRCADSFMLCFCAISKTMFSSSSSSILFLSVSRSCARHAWMKMHIQLIHKIVLSVELLQAQHMLRVEECP